jgi:6-pyruvoyltetrahydropterin/6-carboxytetrahydropterin synthase
MSAESYRVRIGKDHLVFCCGHFITYEGDKCEPLHGHNYRAEVELHGQLDQNCYLFDFIALKKHAKAITDELDHRLLLPTSNRYIRVEDQKESIRVRCMEREWVFPRSDCILLPVENTTAELLARHIGMRLLDKLRQEHRFAPELMRVEVEEGIGQSATWEWRP